MKHAHMLKWVISSQVLNVLDVFNMTPPQGSLLVVQDTPSMHGCSSQTKWGWALEA